MSTNKFQLSRKNRKAVLTLHIMVSVAWIGANLGLLSLAVVALTTTDGRLVAAGISAIVIIIPPVVPALALASALTGVLLGLGTKWGLLTHWWVATKLAINLVLVVLVGILLLPNALSMATPDPGLSADQLRGDYDLVSVLMPPIVSSVALIAATVLAVYKPAGRIRKASTVDLSAGAPADTSV